MCSTFSVFDHTSSGKHDVPLYGDEETDIIDLHEVTEDGDLFVLIKDGFGGIPCLDGIHMMYLVTYCLPFRCGMLGP